MASAGGWEIVDVADDDNPVVGDLRLSGPRLAKLATFGDAVAQAVAVELRWWLGNWFLDTSRGVPYVQELLRRGVSTETVRALLIRRIEAVEGVRRVQSLDVAHDRVRRLADVSNVVIVTTEGEAIPIDNTALGGRL